MAKDKGVERPCIGLCHLSAWDITVIERTRIEVDVLVNQSPRQRPGWSTRARLPVPQSSHRPRCIGQLREIGELLVKNAPGFLDRDAHTVERALRGA